MKHQQSNTWKHFEQNPLTHSAAHYLMTIKELIDENGYARVTDVAKKMKITPGSCSLSLKALKKRKLIEEDKNRFLLLSQQGQELAIMVTKNEQILEKFFRDVLGVDAWQAEIDSCKMEHLISMETSTKLCSFLHFLEESGEDTKKIIKAFKQKNLKCKKKVNQCDICHNVCWVKRNKEALQQA